MHITNKNYIFNIEQSNPVGKKSILLIHFSKVAGELIKQTDV